MVKGKFAIFMLILFIISVNCVNADDLTTDEGDLNTNIPVSDENVVVDSSDVSSESDSSAYLVLDNDADKENIAVNELVSWIVSVQNFGPHTSKNTQVHDELPEGLIYISHTATKGTFNPQTGIWDIGDLTVDDGEVFLTITTKAVTVGEKINKATLTSDTFNLNNESYEEEEIDVFDNDWDDDDSDKSIKEEKDFNLSVNNKTGNPVFLILMSCLLIVYFRFKAKK